MPSTADITDRPAVASDHAGAITTLRIDGMTCGNCARHATEALQSVPGVQYANVALQSNEGKVRWRAGAGAAPEKLIRAIEEAGYSARTIEPMVNGGPQTESL